MSKIECRKCGREFMDENAVCPSCKAPANPSIPNYPRFKGQGVIMFFWITFIILCVGLMLSYYAQ